MISSITLNYNLAVNSSVMFYDVPLMPCTPDPGSDRLFRAAPWRRAASCFYHMYAHIRLSSAQPFSLLLPIRAGAIILARASLLGLRRAPSRSPMGTRVCAHARIMLAALPWDWYSPSQDFFPGSGDSSGLRRAPFRFTIRAEVGAHARITSAAFLFSDSPSRVILIDVSN